MIGSNSALGGGVSLRALLVAVTLGTLPLAGQSDSDGSLDLDLVATVSAPAQSPVGTGFTATVTVTNLASSEGPAFDIGLVISLPDGVTLASAPVGWRVLGSTVDEMTERTRYALESTEALVLGDSLTIPLSLAVAPTVPVGTSLEVLVAAYADDSPFERGLPPSTAPPGTPNGYVDVSYPTSVASTAALSDADNQVPSFPASPFFVDAVHVASTITVLSIFSIRVDAAVAENERATGTGTNAYLTHLKVIGNGVATVTDITLTNVLSDNREFLGFTNVPAGVTAIAVPNTPNAGQVTLVISGATAPLNGTTTISYLSGITEYRVTDARNPATTPSDADPATQTGALVHDGGLTVSGGAAATDLFTATAGIFQAEPISGALLPAPATESTEAEYIALQKSRDAKIKVLGDRVTYTLTYQASEYLSVIAPFVITDTLPDGLTFDGAGSVASSVSDGVPLEFDVSSGVADPVTGDTVIRFILPGPATLPAGATGTITFTATVDGVFEGPGEQDYEAGETLTNLVSHTARVGDEGSTDPSILNTDHADDSAASIQAPGPALSKVLVSVTLPDGTVYDGRPSTPTYTNGTTSTPGTILRFAIVATFPNVETLGVILTDYFPLLTSPSTLAVNTDAALVDIFGNSLPFNDADGDGDTDASFSGTPSPFSIGDGMVTETVSNGLTFGLGRVPPSARLVLLVDTVVTTEDPYPLPVDGLIESRNVALLSYANDQGGVIETITDNQEFLIGVPHVTISKSVVTGATGLDAGDKATFRITLTNDGQQTAYLDGIVDNLPNGLTFVPESLTITDDAQNDVAATVAFAQNGQSLTYFFNEVVGDHPNALPSAIAGAPAASAIVHITYDVVLDAATRPATTLTNTATTRYFSSKDAPFDDAFEELSTTASLTTAAFSIAKVLASTTATHTTGSDLTHGESATFRITVGCPEGTYGSVVLNDPLPTGFALTAASIVSVDGALVTNGGTGPVIETLDLLSNDGVLDTARFTLGTVSTPVSSSTALRTLVVEVTGRLRNISNNTQNKVLLNTASLTLDGHPSGSATASVTVREPRIIVKKSVSQIQVDRADTVTYTLRVYHQSSSRADAFDVVVSDPVPDQWTILGVGPARTSSGTVTTPTLAGSGALNDPVTMTVAHLPRGQWAEFDLLVRLDLSLPAGSIITNTAALAGTSLPGTATDERTKTDTDAVSVSVPDLSITKVATSTSEASTTGSNVTIGEVVRFTLTVTVPESETTEVRILDTLPSGMLFMEQVSLATSGSLSATTINPSLTAVGQELTWNFGTLVNADTDNSSIETITIVYDAVVANVASNQAGTSLTNTARVLWTGHASASAQVTCTVRTTHLATSVEIPTVYGRAGDTVVASVAFWHTAQSGNLAQETRYVVTLPTELTYVGNEVFSGVTPSIDTATPGIVVYDFGDLPTSINANNPIRWQIVFTIPAGFSGGIQTVAGRGTWTSLEGTAPLAILGLNTASERTGETSDPGGLANDYEAVDQATFDDRSTFMIGFEDLAVTPSRNDFDYNDLVLLLDTDETYDGSNQLTHLFVTMEMMARGAGFDHQVFLRLGIKGSVTVTVNKFDSAGFPLDSTTFVSDGEMIEDFEVFTSSQLGLPTWEGSGFAANTAHNQRLSQAIPGFVTTVDVAINQPSLNPEVRDVEGTPGVNEHLQSLYGVRLHILQQNFDVFASGVHRNATMDFVSAEAFPGTPLVGFPLEQSEIFLRTHEWPIEFIPIWTAYPDYVAFTYSGRTLSTDWAGNPTLEKTWPIIHDAPVVGVPSRSNATPHADADAGKSIPTDRAVTAKESTAPASSGVGYAGGAAVNSVSAQLPVLMSAASGGSLLTAAPVAVDLDQDGRFELLFAGFDGRVHHLDPITGNILATLDPGPGLTSLSSLTLIDLTGDGTKEVVRGFEDGTVRALSLTGAAVTTLITASKPVKSTAAVGPVTSPTAENLVVLTGDMKLHVLIGTSPAPGFPVTVGSLKDEGSHYFILSSPTLGDLDQDGTAEIILGNLEGQLVVREGDGTARPGFPYALSGPITSTPSVANLAGDSQLEIVAMDHHGRMVVLNADGTPLPGWPIQIPLGGGSSSPTLADLDHDGTLEILVGTPTGAVYAYDITGTVRPGWPFQTPAQISAAPAVGNLDADPELEIAIGSFNGSVYVLNHDGTAANPFPDPNTYPFPTGGMIVRSPAILDIDGDGMNEICVPTYATQCVVLRTLGQRGQHRVSYDGFKGNPGHTGTVKVP